jgi:hypothetical protein
MNNSFGLVLVVGCVSLAASCGGGSNDGPTGSGGSVGSGGAGGTASGSAGAQGADGVTYTTGDGTSHPFTGKAFARIENVASSADLMIWIYSEDADTCGYPALALGKPWVQLEVIRYATGAAPIAPGTYSFALVDENPGNVRGLGYVRHYETGCNVQAIVRNSSDGLPGSITITSISDTEVVGTFDFDGEARPTGQGHASGAFRASVCGASIGTMCAP